MQFLVLKCVILLLSMCDESLSTINVKTVVGTLLFSCIWV